MTTRQIFIFLALVKRPLLSFCFSSFADTCKVIFLLFQCLQISAKLIFLFFCRLQIPAKLVFLLFRVLQVPTRLNIFISPQVHKPSEVQNWLFLRHLLVPLFEQIFADFLYLSIIRCQTMVPMILQ